MTVKKPLMPYLVPAHLKGTMTIGAYALDAESKAKWLCLDGDTDDHFQSLVRLAGQLEKENITAYLELSRRGGHLWLFTSPLSGANIRRFGKQLVHEYGLPENIELYPKQVRLITGTGSLVRLPLGIHRKTKRGVSKKEGLDKIGASHHNAIPANTSSATQLVLFVTYHEQDTQIPLTTQDRDNLIRLRYAKGEVVSDLAKEYGISDKRVYQILRENGK